MAKTQAKAKQQAEAEVLLFENYLFSSYTLSCKHNRRCSKKCTKSKYDCVNEVIWLMTMKMELKMKNISSWYDKNWPKSRHGHKYTKYKMRLSIKMVYMY